MARLFSITLLVLLLSTQALSTPIKLTLTGSSTIAPLISEVGKLFEAKNPATRIDVQSGGSSRGILDARQGLSQIGMVSRSLKEDEKDLAAFPIAKDGICLITHKTNPIASLTEAQIIAIYTGKIRRWSEVGGIDTPITVVNKAEGRSTLELFLHYFKLRAPDIKAQVVIGDNQQGIKTVAGNPNAIGYVSIGSAEYEAKAGSPIKLLPMANVAPTTENVRNGAFPLSRTLHLVTKGQPQGVTKNFIDFARSKDVHGLIQEQFFVPMVQ